MTTLLGAVLALCLAGGLRAQEAPPDELSRELKWALSDAKTARELAAEKARRGAKPPRLSRGLPPTVDLAMIQADGYVRAERMPGTELPIDASALRQAGLKIEDVFDDEEWVHLPDGRPILRELKVHPLGRYEVWRYPPGARIVHLVYLKASRELFELRLEEKQADEPGGEDGAWAFGVYRPRRGALELYRLGRLGRPERPVVAVDTPSGPRQLRVEHVDPESCRFCHGNHGDGWYQYADEDHAGPCGFVPANRSILARWAPAYKARHGFDPFVTAP